MTVPETPSLHPAAGDALIRPRGRVVRFESLDADLASSGGVAFVTYCRGSAARSKHRRDSILRANSIAKSAVRQSRDPYPAAVILLQRVGVTLEDLARLVNALSHLGKGDVFDNMRNLNIAQLDELFESLALDRKAFMQAVRLPGEDDVRSVEPALAAALVEASNILTARWHRQWKGCEAGWGLVRRIAKAARHGLPLVPRELVTGEPGAGLIGEGVRDVFDRWVLVSSSTVDRETNGIETTSVPADLSDQTLARCVHIGLDAAALTRQLGECHVARVDHGCAWTLPPSAVPRGRRHNILRTHSVI